MREKERGWDIMPLETVANEFNYDLAGLVVNVAMLFVTVVSVACAFIAYFHQKNRSKKDAACQLAKYYADTILEQYSFIASVYRRAGLDVKIQKAIDFNDLHYLDRMELEAILKKKNIDYAAFLKEVNEIDPVIILRCKSLRTKVERQSAFGELVDKYEKTNTLDENDKEFLRKLLNQSITDFLNSLEWFCMNCQYSLADEEILYQSLQKTFLSAVWLMAPRICNVNVKTADKLYTNVIWLFGKWRKRLKKMITREKRRQKALTKKVEKYQKQMRESIFTGKKLK